MSCPSRKPMHLHILLLRRLIKWMSKFTFFQTQGVLYVTVVADLKIRFVFCSSSFDVLLTSQGLRPEIPENTHPKLSDLMQRCWNAAPSNRPPFSVIREELQELLREVQVNVL